ncbi:glycoside hydrolase superfamily [Leptodontidium sp. 2 PMI_412]|nr:glycoside hydrolase superfamily [Leptodontidium sp. 2 PMI_412]
MRLLQLFVVLTALFCHGIGTDDGPTDAVTWYPYSFTVNSSRVFILHLLGSVPANCTISECQFLRCGCVYFFWSYHSSSKGVYDFETSGKNVQRLFDYAKEAGLWVIARAGPYCNAETNGGGFALWGSDGSLGNLQTSDATYHEAWLPPVILNQIENELQETTHSATNTLVIYMEQIKSAFRDAGITMPFTYNEKGMRTMSWSTDLQNVGGAVNVYGLDSYPGGFSCTNVNSGFNLVRTYYQWFSNYSYTQPNYFPEFEAGYFTPWGGSFPDDCVTEHNPALADVYYKNNIGQRTTLLSLYMAWGGTNWVIFIGAAPVVYSSYDYSAPLRETRQIQDKFYLTKLISLFTRVSTDLLKTHPHQAFGPGRFEIPIPHRYLME